MELNTFIISDHGRFQADTGQNDDLVMSLALSIYGARRYREQNPGVVINKNYAEAQPMSPLKSWNMGAGIREDITWLMKD